MRSNNGSTARAARRTPRRLGAALGVCAMSASLIMVSGGVAGAASVTTAAADSGLRTASVQSVASAAVHPALPAPDPDPEHGDGRDGDRRNDRGDWRDD